MFGRNLREERRYRRDIMLEIDEVNSSNLNVFGDHIKKLGPCKSTRIPIEVYNDEGNKMDPSKMYWPGKMAN